jgi:high-affinity iron transporter
VFREGAETVVFLWGIMAEAASAAGWGSVLAGIAGIGMAAALGWAIFCGGRSVSLPRFFSITTTLILFLAAGLFSTGLGRLQSLGVLPMMAPLWDTSSLLSDGSIVGSFLGGLLGYRARPSLLEVSGYVAYLLGAGFVVLGDSPWPPRS